MLGMALMWVEYIRSGRARVKMTHTAIQRDLRDMLPPNQAAHFNDAVAASLRARALSLSDNKIPTYNLLPTSVKWGDLSLEARAEIGQGLLKLLWGVKHVRTADSTNRTREQRMIKEFVDLEVGRHTRVPVSLERPEGASTMEPGLRALQDGTLGWNGSDEYSNIGLSSVSEICSFLHMAGDTAAVEALFNAPADGIFRTEVRTKNLKGDYSSRTETV